MSVIPDQPVIPDGSSAALSRLGLYKDSVGRSMEVPGKAGKMGSINLLTQKISSSVVHGRIRAEAKRTTVFVMGKNQLMFFEIQPFWFCIGLRTLELPHRVSGNHVTAE